MPRQTAVISEQGLRPQMEDAHFLDNDFAGREWVYGGIYDGHGGAYAAEYAGRNLNKLFLESIRAGATPEQAFNQAYQAISDELKGQDSGTTAIDFLVEEKEIIAANAGDARAIVVGEKEITQLTTDHRLDNKAERERITGMGGQVRYPYVYRGYLGLMPTRTIGDEYFKPVGVIATPSVKRHPISGSDLMLLAACDGLFDIMSNSEVADFVRRIDQPEPLVEALKNEVLLNRRGTDNLTIIAVSLR